MSCLYSFATFVSCINYIPIEWCVETRRKYHVMPMKSWGDLPMNMIESWRSNACDRVFTVQRMSKVPLAKCSEQNGRNESLPLIAIMAATTTRKVL